MGKVSNPYNFNLEQDYTSYSDISESYLAKFTLYPEYCNYSIPDGSAFWDSIGYVYQYENSGSTIETIGRIEPNNIIFQMANSSYPNYGPEFYNYYLNHILAQEKRGRRIFNMGFINVSDINSERVGDRVYPPSKAIISINNIKYEVDCNNGSDFDVFDLFMTASMNNSGIEIIVYELIE